MTISPFLVKNVMRTYDQQVDAARRLARIRKLLNPADQGGDTVSISQAAKRSQLVARVTNEIVENLMGSSTDNAVVNSIRAALNREFETEFVFTYHAGGEGLQILENKDGQVVDPGPERKEKVMARLWGITREKVDETMI
ncbi:MAG: hypothetical protein EOM25_03680 [Deltaproteobacteria bacterium]|nr:hypothetical protein [Deltaproteobacteria bacterium]